MNIQRITEIPIHKSKDCIETQLSVRTGENVILLQYSVSSGNLAKSAVVYRLHLIRERMSAAPDSQTPLRRVALMRNPTVSFKVVSK